MAIQPKDILALAVALSDQDAETAWRASASRAYYAAFHNARELAPLDIQTARVNAHAKLILWLRGFRDKNGAREQALAKCGLHLAQMKETREDADYDIRKNFPKGDALRLLRKSEILFDLIVGLTTGTEPPHG